MCTGVRIPEVGEPQEQNTCLTCTRSSFTIRPASFNVLYTDHHYQHATRPIHYTINYKTIKSINYHNPQITVRYGQLPQPPKQWTLMDIHKYSGLTRRPSPTDSLAIPVSRGNLRQYIATGRLKHNILTQ